VVRGTKNISGKAAAVLAALSLAAAAAAVRAQSQLADPCEIRTTERVVAVGDVHGAYDSFVAILRAAGILDTRDRWIGSRAILVQTGDVLDRGPASRRALDLLRRLERDASRAGGRVYAMLGNHEVMRMQDDWRYVSAGEYAAFETPDSRELRERAYGLMRESAVESASRGGPPFDETEFRARFLKEIPLGYVEMRQAFAPTGDYGRWLRDRPAAVRINGVLFVHGGISEGSAALGCAGINAAVRRELTADPPPDLTPDLVSTSETGPLWYRGLAQADEAAFGPLLDTILQATGARAIVIGHTVTPAYRVTPRFGGRVIQIDTGMIGGTFVPGGVGSALEMRGDTLRAYYRDRTEALPPLPAPQ
jgi:hypothetical protein